VIHGDGVAIMPRQLVALERRASLLHRSAARVAKGQRGAAIDVPAHCFERARPPAVPRIVARRTRGASRCSTGPLGRQLTGTMAEHRCPAPSRPWAGRDGEGRSGSKGGQGPARGNISAFGGHGSCRRLSRRTSMTSRDFPLSKQDRPSTDVRIDGEK
jgi:hypothetical protein